MKPTRWQLLLSIFISTSLHVSVNCVPIIRRTYCICAILVFFTLNEWLSGLQTGQPPIQRILTMSVVRYGACRRSGSFCRILTMSVVRYGAYRRSGSFCRILTMSVFRYGAYRRSGSAARAKWNCVVKEMRIPFTAHSCLSWCNEPQSSSQCNYFFSLHEKTLKFVNGTCLLLSRELKHSFAFSPFFLLLGAPGAINPLVIYFCILSPFVTVENLHTHCEICGSCGGGREVWCLLGYYTM